MSKRWKIEARPVVPGAEMPWRPGHSLVRCQSEGWTNPFLAKRALKEQTQVCRLLRDGKWEARVVPYFVPGPKGQEN